MADLLGMDPARIARLRSPERLVDLDPERVWEVVDPVPGGTIVDLGAGVGFLTLPFARRFPRARVIACDVLEGMLALLAEDAAGRGLDNVECVRCGAASLPLPDGCADLLISAQVHHELDEPEALLAECRRVLAPGGTIAIVDWKDEDNGASPPAGRRVPAGVIRAQLERAGFTAVRGHDLYRYHAFLTARA